MANLVPLRLKVASLRATVSGLRLGKRQLVAITSILIPVVALPMLAHASDWPSYSHEPGHSDNAVAESTLSPATVSGIVRRWSFLPPEAISASSIVAQPTVVNGIVYIGSWDGYEYAVNAQTGVEIWKQNLGKTISSKCFGTNGIGITSSAAVYNSVVYVGGGDQNFYALDAASGNILWSVPTGQAGSGVYNWASPAIYTAPDGNAYAYMGVASLCDNPLVQGQLLQIDLATHQIARTFDAVPNGVEGGGIWSSPAVDPDTNTVFVTTGNDHDTPPGHPYAAAIVALDATTLAVKGSWQIPLAQLVPDPDWAGSSPVIFTDSSGRKLVAAIHKNGYLYAFDRSNVSAGPVWERQVAASGGDPYGGDGSISTGAFDGSTLYEAGGNTIINGVSYQGAVRAFDPATGNIIWEHGVTAVAYPNLVYANGLIISGNNTSVEVLDAQTGQRLYSTSVGGTLYGLSVANGMIYAGAGDHKLYAFGLPAAAPTATATASPDANCPSGWLCQDVGSPTPAGSDGTNGNGVYTVTGGGANGLGGTSDQFRFIAQPFAAQPTTGGDLVLAAQVISQAQTTGLQAASGLMVRQSLAANDLYYGAFLEPGTGLVIQSRTAAGAKAVVAPIPQSFGTAAAPLYLEIRRTSDDFTTAFSTDGTNYTLVPGSQVSVIMTSAVLAGLAVTSHSSTVANTGTFSSVTLGKPSSLPAPTLATALPDSTCPQNWTCQNLSSFAPNGSLAVSGSTWTMTGAGQDRNGTYLTYKYGSDYDEWHAAWTTVTGDTVISTRVITETATASWTKVGIFMRASPDPDAPFYAVWVTPKNGIVVQARYTQGAFNRPVIGFSAALPVYLQITRSGDTFTVQTSPDGSTWTTVNGSSATIPMSSNLLAGLGTTSFVPGSLATGTFDTVALNGMPVGMGSQPTITPSATATATSTGTATSTATGTPTGTLIATATATSTGTATGTATATSTSTATPTATATGTASPSCPAGWGCADIGSVGAAGGQRLNAGTWTVQGAGADIYGSADAFHFVWQTLNGDGGVSARVISQTHNNPWAKAGVMLRASTDPGAPFYAALVTPGYGFFVEYRKAQGGTVVRGTSAAGTVPIYLKVARSGSGYSAYSSSDGAAWTPLPGSSVALSLPSGLLAGLAVTSHSVGVLSTVTFDTVTIG